MGRYISLPQFPIKPYKRRNAGRYLGQFEKVKRNLQAAAGGGGYVFVDPTANIYYEGVKTANAGDVDAITLYSLTLDTLKAGIDTLFLGIKSSGMFVKSPRFFPFVGATPATHAINGVNGLSELLYIGSPGHSNLGVILNGTSQAVDVNNVPDNDGSLNNHHVVHWIKNVTNNFTAAGARDNTFAGILSRIIPPLTYNCQVLGVNLNGVTTDTYDKFIISGLRDQNDRQIYENGVLIDSGGAGSTSNAIVNSTILGAINNIGSLANYSAGNLVWGGTGEGPTDGEALAYYNAVNGFQTLLGR